MTTEMNNAVTMPQMEQKSPAMQERPRMKSSDRMLLKLILIGLMSLLLLIPQQLLRMMVDERNATAMETIDEVGQSWSRAQRVVGPVVHIPSNNNETQDVYLLPEELSVTGDLQTETLHRGIFDVTVYTADMDLRGSFQIPSLSEYSASKYDLSKAEVLIALKDLRGLKENVTFQLKGKDYAMKSDQDGELGSVLCCKVPIEELNSDTSSYSVKLLMKGSNKLMFLPVGSTTTVALRSNCATPSFQGNFLPETRQVSDSGFSASWKVLALNRDFAQSVTRWGCGNNAHSVDMSENEFGVMMKVPVLQYQQTTRCIKYAYLFIFLTFATVFFVEYRRQTPIHPVQYLLIGVALLVFYTLLLSFSEHIPFSWSYLIATLMTITLITVYLAGILKIRKTALMVGGLLLLLYLFIYVLLQLETYALLFGSLGIFVILAVLMYASQKVRWYKGE